MEIRDIDQQAYVDGMTQLRSMAVPNRAAVRSTDAIQAQLESGTQVKDITGICPHSIAQAEKEYSPADLVNQKPLKPGVFAISRYIYDVIWQTITQVKAGELDELMQAQIARLRAQIDNPLVLAGYIANSLRQIVTVYFHQYLDSMANGRLRMPPEIVESFKQSTQDLDSLLALEQGSVHPVLVQNGKQQMNMTISNAVGTAMSYINIIPAVARVQTGTAITQAEFVEIAENLAELLAIEAMLHLEMLGEVSKETLALRMGQKVFNDPLLHVIGRNTRGKLALAIRPEPLLQAHSKVHPTSPQIGCAMVHIVREFNDLLWRYVGPAFNFDAPNAHEQYQEAMDSIVDAFTSPRT